MKPERVWITRTEPGGSRLNEFLANHEFNCLVEPTLEIQAVSCTVPDRNYELVIYLSSNAVRNIPIKREGTISTLAIGESTRLALKQGGICSRVPDQFTSEGILSLITKDYPTITSILLVCGRNSRSMLARTLVENGKTVDVVEVYRRVPRSFDLAKTIEFSDVILVDSLDCLSQITSSLRISRTVENPRKIIITPTERIGREARKYRSFSVYVSDGISPENTLNTLKEVFANERL